jgi:hypothetical protein
MKGMWTEEESHLSINILGVEAFKSNLWCKSISLFSDNSTVVAYIRRYRLNKQLSLYYSPLPDDKALGVDSLSAS